MTVGSTEKVTSRAWLWQTQGRTGAKRGAACHPEPLRVIL